MLVIVKVPNLKVSSSEVFDTLNSAACEILFRHLKTFDQDTSHRYKLLIEMYFNELTKDFRNLVPDNREEKVKPTVEKLLPALSHIIEYCRGFPLVSKKELTNAIKVEVLYTYLISVDFLFCSLP